MVPWKLNRINEYYKIYLDNNPILNSIMKLNTKDKGLDDTLMPQSYFKKRDPDCRIYLEDYNYIFNINILIEGKAVAYCPITKEKCDCFYSRTYSSCDETFGLTDRFFRRAWHFNSSAGLFIIFTSWEYSIPYFIYSGNDLHNICPDSSPEEGSSQCYIIEYLGKYLSRKDKLTPSLNPNIICYGIGFQANLGHYVWQEVMGLCKIISCNLGSKIKFLLRGKHDYLNISQIFINIYPHVQVISIENPKELEKPAVICNLACTNITQSYANVFKEQYLKYFKVVKYISKPPEIKAVTFIIRNGLSRTVTNNLQIINKTIEYLTNTYDCSFIFYIVGWFKFKSSRTYIDHQTDTNEPSILEKQNELLSKVKSSNVDLTIRGKFNVDVRDIISIFSISDFIYDETGSSSILYPLVVKENVKIIWHTNKVNYDNFAKQNTLLNGKEIITLSKECINDHDTTPNTSYDINEEKYIDTLKCIEIFSDSSW